jgi:hypothetical protein
MKELQALVRRILFILGVSLCVSWIRGGVALAQGPSQSASSLEQGFMTNSARNRPTATPTPTPTYTIKSPVNGATVSGSVTLAISSTLSTTNDWWNGLSVDGVSTGLTDTGHYQQIILDSTKVANGTHTLTVLAHQQTTGTVEGSASISVVVSNYLATPTPAPTPTPTPKPTPTPTPKPTPTPTPKPTPTGTPSPTPTPGPTPVAHFGTLAPHAALPTGAQCSQMVANSSWEPRPENTQANNTVPSATELAGFYAQPLNFSGGPPASDFQIVDGNYKGTTDMIIRWAACKWGVDEDILRAEAYYESTWSSYTTGDLRTVIAACEAGDWYGWDPVQNYCWQSYGLTQVKFASYNTWPMAWDSTAFNADFRGAYWRACMNGDVSYYYNMTPTAGYPAYPNGTTDQMAWGCMGSWSSGAWYDSGGLSYISTLESLVAAKPWLSLPATPSASLSLIAPANNQTVSGNVEISISLNQSDPKACYACLSIDGVSQTCTPAVGPWTWDTNVHVLNGHHAIQVDAYTCSGGNPNYHAAADVIVNN